MARQIFIAAIMILTALSTAMLNSPKPTEIYTPDLDAMIPGKIPGWTLVELPSIILPPEIELVDGEAVAYRAYRDLAGRIVTIVVAYGPPLGDSVRLHRPESCYVAQGYTLNERTISFLTLHEKKIPIVRLSTEKLLRQETVSYWLRDGSSFVTNGSTRQFRSLRSGLYGESETVLIRVSTVGGGRSIDLLHDEFFSSFTAALSDESRKFIYGTRI